MSAPAVASRRAKAVDPALDALEARLRRVESAAAITAMACGGAAMAMAFESAIVGAVAAATTLAVIALRPRRPETARGPAQVDAVDATIAAGGLALGLWLARSTESITTGLGVFLLCAQALKLARPRVATDTPIGLVIGLVLAAVSTAEGVEPLFGGLLALDLAALLTATAARATAEEARGALALGAVGALPAVPTRRRAVVRHGLRLAALGLAALLVFFLAPRTGAMQFLPARRESRERTSGFSDRVGLGDIGRIQQSDSIALRVEVERGARRHPNDLYLRGCALDHYDGQTWTSTPNRVAVNTPLGRDADGVLYDTLVDVPPGERALINIKQQPIGARCLFTTGAVERVRFKGPRPHVVDRDAMGAILCQRTPTTQLVYQLETHIGVQVPQVRLRPGQTRRLRDACLNLPPTIHRERLLEYARRALTLRRVPEDAPPSVIAAALEGHLAATNRYTLDATATPGAEPVQDFLLVRREGHCEYFASSHVVLLRLLGIPARLVTGFRGGEESAFEDAIIVRQRHAHAWVEAEVETGWTRYDPTPAASGTTPGVLGAMGDLADWVELKWYAWVVALDGQDQRNVLMRLRELLLELTDELPAGAGARDLLTGLAAALVLGLLALALGIAVWGRARRRARAGAASPTPAAQGEGLVREALAALARRGVPRRADETLLEVAARARATLGPGVEPLLRWAPRYHEARWGGGLEDPTRGPEADALRRALADLVR